jgi:hypothetical protein
MCTAATSHPDLVLIKKKKKMVEKYRKNSLIKEAELTGISS